MEVVTRHLPEVPRWLADFGATSMHEYKSGVCLADLAGYGHPVRHELMVQLAEFFARLASVPVSELPPLSADRPAPGDSTAFLRWRVDWTEQRVRRANEDRLDGLFEAFGVPADALESFERRLPVLTARPFCLLHTDVHRANVVVYGSRITVIDWELALYGDPLHDLATHLVRMEYDEEERERMVKLWSEAMNGAGLGDMTAGLDDDLPVHLAFEYAQSVFPDLMRAALTLPPAPGDADFAAAAWRMCRSVRRAAGPLGLVSVPDEEEAAEALSRWWRGSGGRVGR
ncbi:aminoglycoside phosphotransferase family protein [Streptomyces sp. NPDC058308]|uniref:aminoglycoside phosphotransferase family protein n=1 Tax=Streptomyces sp. NPDC058308 TaxID=3346440 RepID=UPI0036EC845D